MESYCRWAAQVLIITLQNSAFYCRFDGDDQGTLRQAAILAQNASQAGDAAALIICNSLHQRNDTPAECQFGNRVAGDPSFVPTLQELDTQVAGAGDQLQLVTIVIPTTINVPPNS